MSLPGFLGFPIEGASAGLGTPVSHTGSATISSGGIHDNIGASGTITFTLAATPGLHFVVKRIATQEVRIAPASGKTILWSGGTMAANEYLRLTGDGATIEGYVDSTGDVQVIAEFGLIAEQTP